MATLSKLDSPLFTDHVHATVSFFIEHITAIYIRNLSSIYHFSFILDSRDLLCLVTQSCPTVCGSMDCSPPGSSVHRDSPGKNQRRQWHPTLVLLPGTSQGWRSLVGCSPWGLEESDRTERLHFHFSLSCIGGGNGNPLQCSCLENPRDRGAWWAAISGVTQSRT